MPHLLLVTLVAVAIGALQGALPERPLGGNPDGSPSPDGRLISLLDEDRRQLAVDDIQTGEPLVRLALGNYLGSTAVSYDGRQVAFSSGVPGEGAGLRVLPIPSLVPDSPRLLALGADIDPIEWSRDGRLIVVRADTDDGTEVRLVDATDGSFRVMELPEGLSYGASPHRSVALSPDGLVLAIDLRVPGAGGRRAVFLLSASGGTFVRLAEPTAWHSVIGWTPDGGHVLVLSDRGGTAGLWAFPVGAGRPTGEPRLLQAPVDGRRFSVLANGDVAYERVTGPPAARLVTARIDSDGRLTDGPTPFATDNPLAFARFPRWSADGRSFMYVETALGGPVAVIQTDGIAGVRRVPLGMRSFATFDWSPDASQIVFRGNNADGQACLCLLDLKTGDLRVLSPPSAHPQFSANGTAISYFLRSPGPPVTWSSYVERAVNTQTERVVVDDLSPLISAPRALPGTRSPDGRHLLAVVIGATSRLLAYDTQTREVREIFSGAGGEAFNHYEDMQWTPDSRAVIATVASAMHDEGNEQELWWIPVDGRAARKIDVGSTLIGENRPALHPDGQRIAFVLGKPFNGILPVDFRPGAVGSPTEMRVIGGIAEALGRQGSGR